MLNRIISAALLVFLFVGATSAPDGRAEAYDTRVDVHEIARQALQDVGDDDDDGLAGLGRIVAGLVVAAAVIGLAVVLVRRVQRRRRQLAVVRPNLDNAVTQGLPNVPAMVVDKRDGEAQLTALGGPEGRRTFTFGSVPLRIGSATDSDVRVEASPDVAPRHAAIYMRDRKIVLRHTGGSRRPTFVSGQAIDLVILDDGDEFAIGPYRFRAEITESQIEAGIPGGLLPNDATTESEQSASS